jgi:hypothetical protein
MGVGKHNVQKICVLEVKIVLQTKKDAVKE